MIDAKRFTLIEDQGYASRKEAYDTIKKHYSNVSGVTTYFDEGEWYIVQSRALK